MPTRLDMKVSALPSREERSWAGHFAGHTRWMKLPRERAGKQFVRKRGGKCQKIVKTLSKPCQNPVTSSCLVDFNSRVFRRVIELRRQCFGWRIFPLPEYRPPDRLLNRYRFRVS